MTMIFPQHKQSASWRKQNKIIWVFLIFALTALIFILLRSKSFENLSVNLFSKINFLRSDSTLIIKESRLYLARLEALEEENKSLKSLSGHKISEEILAEIRLGGGYLFSDILLLNVGKKDGVNMGDLVFNGGKIFVGKISEVGDVWSKVFPIGRLGEKISLRVGGDKEVLFEAVGAGRGELITELPKELVIVLGDLVWLGENPAYPVGLVINIQKTEGREMQVVRMASPLQLGTLIGVTVLRSQ